MCSLAPDLDLFYIVAPESPVSTTSYVCPNDLFRIDPTAAVAGLQTRTRPDALVALIGTELASRHMQV